MVIDVVTANENTHSKILTFICGCSLSQYVIKLGYWQNNHGLHTHKIMPNTGLYMCRCKAWFWFIIFACVWSTVLQWIMSLFFLFLCFLQE